MVKCPRCAADVSENLSVCPKCGLAVSKFAAFEHRISNLEFGNPSGDPFSNKMTKEEKKAAKKARKEEKKQAKKEKKIRESQSDTDFSVYALNSKNGVRQKHYDNSYMGRKQRAKDNKKYPEFTIDQATGEFNIDTSDVEIVGAETGKIIEEQHQSYSVKKSRGDYAPKKIKWWELYKLTDRHFARRKIKKQVNTAAKIKPGFINKTKLLLFAIFFGWMGAPNFYAKNYKKGIFTLVMLFIWTSVVWLAGYSKFFASIELSVGGFAGFVTLFIWVSDIVNIAFGSFRYRIQKEAFLCKLNFNTRAKLGEKYYDMELYKKPFWTRAKVWLARRKREHEVAKRERAQNKIEKEKRKAEKANEQAKVDLEIAEAEKNEARDLQAEKDAEKLAKMRSEILNSETTRSINSFDGGKTVEKPDDPLSSAETKKPKKANKEKPVETQPKQPAKARQAKVKVASSKKKSNKK